MRKTMLMAVVALLVLSAALPAAAEPAAETGRVHTGFHGLYFPAGMPGTETACPEGYTWLEMPPSCVMDPGTTTVLPNGRVLIQDLGLYELAFAYDRSEAVEPRKTGYDLVVANAYLDGTFSGPTWGTWNLYSFEDELMFTGVFTGRFKDGIPAVRFFGEGTGDYDGQIMFGRVTRVPDPWNMFGHILDLSLVP